MQKQKQILNQKLNLGPLQIQFLNLLQIPIVDLDKRIEKEIEENPAIEEHDEDDLSSEKTYQNNIYKNNESKTELTSILSKKAKRLNMTIEYYNQFMDNYASYIITP